MMKMLLFFVLAAPLIEKYEVPVFCYPFGHYNDTAKQVLKDIGYKVAFTTKGGRVKKGMDSLELPRVRILRDDSLTSFISKVN